MRELTMGKIIQRLYQQGLLRNEPQISVTAPVALVTDYSPEVVVDTVFICKGAAFRVAYLEQAQALGAICYVSETRYEDIALPCLLVQDVRQAMSLLALLYYGNPSEELGVVGITGTKGKTTTAYFLRSILSAYAAQRAVTAPAFLSSLVIFDGAQERASKLTTPEPLEVQRILRTAADNGCRWAVMEVSSQALKYGRVQGTQFAAGVYLNIGEDHIGPGEHADFEDYFSSKLKLFEQCAVGCVNLDGDMSERALLAAQVCPRLISFSVKIKSADVYADGIEKTGHSFSFHVRTPRYEGRMQLAMGGLFNVSNALAAIAAAEALGIPQGAVAEGLANTRVPGRMETYGTGDVTAWVDYAHNPMSLQALIEAARREYPERELTVVFGCTGGKGLSRRKPMGRVSDLADRVILTADDPAQEDPYAIAQEIAAAASKPCEILVDRGQAVLAAIEGCSRPAIILVAGKGDELIQKGPNGGEDYEGDAFWVQKGLEARARTVK